MMIMYVVEHDEFDIHDNMHVNRSHNNMMLLDFHVHDNRLLKVIELRNYRWYSMIIERKMN
jgi:hypothetical protein